MKVKPLKSKTMTLEQLQKRTLKVLKQVRQQFQRPHFATHGMTDREFVDQVVDSLEWDIKADMTVLKMHKPTNHPSTTNSNGSVL